MQRTSSKAAQNANAISAVTGVTTQKGAIYVHTFLVPTVVEIT